jgi:hypothetical protein
LTKTLWKRILPITVPTIHLIFSSGSGKMLVALGALLEIFRWW